MPHVKSCDRRQRVCADQDRGGRGFRRRARLGDRVCPLCRKLCGVLVRRLAAVGQTVHGSPAKMVAGVLFSTRLVNISSIKLVEPLQGEAKLIAASSIDFDEGGDA
ncbi:MAG: hypothetical protein OXC54_10980 [Rhodospirillaceae bacterium]|nr:hypothetical protein [Rhodospirillaceae bacterium]